MCQVEDEVEVEVIQDLNAGQSLAGEWEKHKAWAIMIGLFPWSCLYENKWAAVYMFHERS